MADKIENLELNGLANIVDHVRWCERTKNSVNMPFVEAQALAQIEYLKQRNSGKEVKWHEVAVKPKAG